MDLGIGEFIVLYAMTSQEDQEDDMLLYLYLEHLRKMKREESARLRAKELKERRRKLVEKSRRKLECIIRANKRRKLLAQQGIRTEPVDVSSLLADVSTSSLVPERVRPPDSTVRLLSLNSVPVYYEKQELLNQPSTSARRFHSRDTLSRTDPVTLSDEGSQLSPETDSNDT